MAAATLGARAAEADVEAVLWGTKGNDARHSGQRRAMGTNIFSVLCAFHARTRRQGTAQVHVHTKRAISAYLQLHPREKAVAVFVQEVHHLALLLSGDAEAEDGLDVLEEVAWRDLTALLVELRCGWPLVTSTARVNVRSIA